MFKTNFTNVICIRRTKTHALKMKVGNNLVFIQITTLNSSMTTTRFKRLTLTLMFSMMIAGGIILLSMMIVITRITSGATLAIIKCFWI